MAGYEYVSPEQLAGFDKYKYSALDTNPLSLYVMHPFWNAIVKVFPTWLAPNLITFSGFLLVVFNFLLLTYFDPDFYASAPGHKHIPDWVWIVVGILNFVAYTLDGVDGKQARRTNSSTPLGELFDHGLDSWSCVYFVVTVYSIFGRGPTGVSVFVLYLLLWVVLFSFILSHWEKYNTGVLFLPWGYDISQVTISFVYIVTAVVGVEAWYEPFLFNFLYRDLFTAMIIGKELHVEACFNITLLPTKSQCVTIASDNTLSLFPSEQNSPTALQGFHENVREDKGVLLLSSRLFLIGQKCQSRSAHKLCKVAFPRSLDCIGGPAFSGFQVENCSFERVDEIWRLL